MQSAAILAQVTKDAQGESSPGGVVATITTVGATIDQDNRIYLHENPLRTITEILCPTCRLPPPPVRHHGQELSTARPIKVILR